MVARKSDSLMTLKCRGANSRRCSIVLSSKFLAAAARKTALCSSRIVSISLLLVGLVCYAVRTKKIFGPRSAGMVGDTGERAPGAAPCLDVTREERFG